LSVQAAGVQVPAVVEWAIGRRRSWRGGELSGSGREILSAFDLGNQYGCHIRQSARLHEQFGQRALRAGGEHRGDRIVVE
jgi:hypothetical protein